MSGRSDDWQAMYTPQVADHQSFYSSPLYSFCSQLIVERSTGNDVTEGIVPVRCFSQLSTLGLLLSPNAFSSATAEYRKRATSDYTPYSIIHTAFLAASPCIQTRPAINQLQLQVLQYKAPGTSNNKQPIIITFTISTIYHVHHCLRRLPQHALDQG